MNQTLVAPAKIKAGPALQPLKILHIALAIGETNETYNEHCLPNIGRYLISICTYFENGLKPPSEIMFFPGNSSLSGFFRTLRQALRTNDYDIVHVHSPHVAFFLLAVTLFTRVSPGTALVCTVHDSFPNFKTRNRLFLTPVFPFYDRIVCCGKASYQSIPGVLRALSGKRLVAIPNGLDIDRVDRIAKSKTRGEKEGNGFQMLVVARLVGIKNIACVLQALKEVGDPGTALRVLGEGPLRPDLQSLGDEKSLGVEFTGVIARDEVYRQMLDADLFVSASKGEGLPVAVLEAMACGCPVLLSDIPPHREIAEGTDFIPLVAPDDAPGFAREIRRFRDMPAEQRKRIGELCRQRVEAHFSLRLMQRRYDDLYRQAIDDRK